MPELVLLRHGQSTWNLENRFTGWTDVPLTEQGVDEATTAGELLAAEGYTFDILHTSLLVRAICDGQHRPGGDGVALAAGQAALASERAPLWGAAGAQQEGDR